MIIKGRALTRYGLIDDICIRVSTDGVITELSKVDCTGDPIYDFRGGKKVILPAMIDIHVHMRDFKQAYKEDYYTGSSSAAAGGVGIILDMPNTSPPIDNLSTLIKRDKLASRKSIVDYGLYYGVPDKPEDLNGYEKYAVGVKIYPRDIAEKGDVIRHVLQYNRLRNRLTAYHPEDPNLIDSRHPLKAELKAAYEISQASKLYQTQIHATHITSGATHRILKTYGRGVSADTCPHYLLLSKDSVDGRYFNVTPPLRSDSIRRELLKLFIRGDVNILSTDHAPHTLDEKYIDGLNGFPGLETALPLLLTLYNKGFITLEYIARVYSQNPAEILNIDHLYSYIDVGYYASLTIVDTGIEYKIDPSKFYSKAKHSPFDGWIVKGKVISTFVRGVLVYHEDSIQVGKGIGLNIVRYLR